MMSSNNIINIISIHNVKIDLLILFHLLLLHYAIANHTVPKSVVCDGVIFSDVYYDKQLIVGNLGKPYNLVIHKYTGLLFFSHTINDGTNVDFGIKACHLVKKTCKDIEGIPGGYAIAYDPGNDDLYFGGHDGIYKYNFLTKSADFFAEEGKSIWSLFVKKHFYYVEYPTQKLYVYQDDKFVQVAESMGIEIDTFFISKNNDIYFSNRTAFYKVERHDREVIVLDDEIMVRQLAEDGFGDMYICGSDGIYVEEKPFHKVRKLAHIDHAYGMTFDEKENIIFSDKSAIYKLVESKYSKLCYGAVIGALRRKYKDRVTGLLS